MNKINFKSKLLTHQKEQVRFHLTNPHSANWSEQGTGKTVVALKSATILHNTELVKTILVICPLSVLHTWELEIEKHTTFSYLSLSGDLTNKLKRLQSPADIYLISYDSIPGRRTAEYNTHGIMMGALLDKEFDLVIGDEVTEVKGYQTLRTRAMTILCDRTPYTLFMSGTPIANNPSDIFNIYRAFDGGKTFGKNFYAIRNKFFRNIGYAYPKWELKEEMRQELFNKMYSNAVRVRKDDCLDLPPKIFSPRFCQLTDEQRQYYIPIVQDLIVVLEVDEGKIKIKNAMSKIIKLSQLTSGFMYTDDKTFVLNENPKAELALGIVKENPNEKIIIYCYWQEDIKILSKMFLEHGYAIGTLYGATPLSERGKIIDAFQKGGLQLLIANIRVGGYGLTLHASSTVIYYNLSFRVLDFLQSQDRIHRHGQAKTCLYLPIFAQGTIDEYIYNTIVKSTAVAASIVDGTSLRDNLKKFLSEGI